MVDSTYGNDIRERPEGTSRSRFAGEFRDAGRGTFGAGTGRADPETLRRLHKFAELLDDRYRVPGTNYRVGIDGLIGMVPGIGDTASALIASYVVFEAYRLGVPNMLLARMLGNIGVDWLIGSIPLAGDVFDFAWKANRRNVSMLLRHLRDGR